jgi:hypothetical protein
MICPRKLDVVDAYAVVTEFVAKEPLESEIHDMVATARNHEDRRHAGMDDVSR